ncbi:MAG: alpha-ribazole phosphatase family protein [Thiotrichaceae bacterium]|nr:alpha-ribazole phosphatase family protein [Thiotrichaceae bacterium]
MKQKKSTITLLRHGEPAGGAIFRGATDDCLTKTGWQQMYDALNTLDSPDLILSSPLRRCADFAEKIAAKRSLPLQKADALQEINFGQWEGRLIEQIAADAKNELARFWQNPVENTPPDGEPVLDFQKRVISFWHELIAAQRGKNCLLLTHGGVQKMILAEVLGMPVHAMHNIEVPYACCSTFHVYYSDTEPVTTLKSHG